MKSLLLLGSNAPHVHLRLRKRFSRCTLDCGFKTSESPALRGFVGGPMALATAALYLVLKSNGLRHSKNLPEKFCFLPIDTPANIVKKLPPQRCSKPLFIAFFSFSHKWPTFAFTSESGYTLGSAQRIAHNGSHGETGGLPFCEHSVALRCRQNTFYSTVLLYTYISRFSVKPHYQQQLYLRPPLVMFFNFPHKRPTFALTPESGYTLGSLRKIAHSGTHGETQGFTHAAVWSVQLSSRIWTEKSRRKRMHALRRVSAFSGVAAPLGCAYICRKYINFPSRILLPKSKDRQEKPLSDVPHPCF